MFVLAELLMAVGVVAIVGCIGYTGYRIGKSNKEDK